MTYRLIGFNYLQRVRPGLSTEQSLIFKHRSIWNLTGSTFCYRATEGLGLLHSGEPMGAGGEWPVPEADHLGIVPPSAK